jgi:hypothetical protein
MIAVAAILTLLASLAFVAGIVLVFPKSKRRIGKRLLIGSPIVFILAIVLSAFGVEQEAKQAGFAGSADRRAAEAAGFTDAALWRAKLDADKANAAAAAEKAAEEARKLAAEKEAAERARKEQEAAAAKAKEEQCRQEITCWAEKHFVSASSSCRQAVEKLARYDFEWTDGLIEPKFGRYRWKNVKNGVVTYIGDKIKLQNGFGAFQNHIYTCDYDTNLGVVVDAFIKLRDSSGLAESDRDRRKRLAAQR